LFFLGNRPRQIQEKENFLSLKRQKDGTTRARGGTAVPQSKKQWEKVQRDGTARASSGTAVPIKNKHLGSFFFPI